MAVNRFVSIRDPAGKVRALCDYGSQVEVDRTIPPKLYFRSGREMLRMANMYCDEGNLESAFILYSKFITLFVEKLPMHPDYKISSPPGDVQEFKKKVKKVFPLAEEIKSKLKKRYAEEEARRQEEEKKKREKLAKEEEKRRLAEEERMREDEALARQLQAEAEEQWMQEQEEKYRRLQLREEERLAEQQRKKDQADGYGGPLVPVPLPVSVQDDSSSTAKGYSSGSHSLLQPASTPTLPDRELKKNLVSNNSIPLGPPPPYTPPTPSVDRSTKPMDHFMSTGMFGGGTGLLREVVVPSDLMKKFLTAAANNTSRGAETMGILCGKVSCGAFKITHLFIPQQHGTPDSCDMEGEEDLIFYQDKFDLVTLGWIHTHPTQTAFLSSVDLHSHYAYQRMLPEAIAIVCSPKFEETGVFSLTDTGMDIIGSCREKGFHYHSKEPPLFENSGHARIVNQETITLADMRK
ncbi:STAM-binding protein-like [Pomacea canaliculata]|uniref:STAM-binding protein-like n=1 Tax=Pomacea canaliculata TaxID=400727 RepID=UPI000D73994E|nr:STAM-binding protein-like [Pomacea canaliculata]XP_025092843.1 STAM-binding protein-like [Pomacea canaliculata]